MPSTLPEGQAAPRDGTLPPAAVETLGTTPFGCYVHVPFCAVRCGYCDFNTYTAHELGNAPGASRDTYAAAAIAEIALARKVLGDRQVVLDTVFFGGGTPTLLPPEDLVTVVAALRRDFGLSPDAEVTTEANPDSVTPADLEKLRAGGINRISIGVQSAVPSVLTTLDRTHDPARVASVVRWARDAGFDQISLDLIYGTPGESLDDWKASVDVALALEPDHLSAYALIVEQGTALARRIARAELPAPDDDDLADKYELVDDALAAAGYQWYEVSNWARGETSASRHNLGYWQGANWWGVGPGAHSHVGGVRWWNVKHPAAYAARMAGGESPAAAREVLDLGTQRAERVLLETRLATGLPLDVLDDGGRAAVPALVADGLAEERPGRPLLTDALSQSPSPAAATLSVPRGEVGDRLVLTRRGRLLADAVVRTLLP